LVLFFICSAGALLMITGTAKLISASGDAQLLQNPDPILSVSFRHVFWVVGVLELILAMVCFFGKRVGLQAGLVALLATNFVVYRLGLILVGYHKPCSCLGNLTDALHISPQTADTAMKIVLGYLLLGSYATLFWLWKEKMKQSPL
jgi:hypothetical protein